MADWDDIECGFNAADETINFGTRKIAAVDNLYETITLALFRNNVEDELKDPNIHAIIQNNAIFFTINKTFRIFEDLSCSNIRFSATFPEEIDVLLVTPNGKYSLICLKNGTVYCFDMENNFTMVHSENIIENDNLEETFFKAAFYEESSSSFVLVLADGQIYKISAEQKTLDDTSENGISQFSSCLLTDLKCSIETAVFKYPELFVAANHLYIVNINLNEIWPYETVCLKKMVLLNPRVLLNLHWDGSLSYTCTKTFLSVNCTRTELYDDFLIINNERNVHFLGVTKRNENGHSFIQRLAYPDFSVIFSLKISQEICLISPEHIADELIYISMLKEDNNVNELRFQIIYETQPEVRLKRLLLKQKFEDAEQFAKLFKLDLLEVQKAKVQAIICKDTCDENDIKNFFNILNNTNDIIFKVQSCLNVHSMCTSLQNVNKVLNYGYSIVLSDADNEESEEMLNLQDDISKLLFHFYTFMELIKCNEERNNMENWIRFSECHMIEELEKLIEHHYIDEAITICNRLDSKYLSKLDEQHVLKIMDLLSKVATTKQLLFLYTFLPLVLSYLPTALPIITKWIINRIYHMEAQYPNEFPNNAIFFINKLVKLLTEVNSTNRHLQQQWLINQNVLEELVNRLETLDRLEKLKNSYGIVIAFDSFFQEPKLALRILINVAAQTGNHQLLGEYLEDISSKNDLNINDTILTMTQDIVQYTNENWIKVIPVLLNAINSIDLKMEATLTILKVAHLPWCKTIQDIAKDALQLSHPLIKEIRKEIEYKPKSYVLKKDPYKLNKICCNSLERFKFAINRIIDCNQETLIEDIYKVCQNSEEKHEANMLLLYSFIQKGEFAEALSILVNNPQKEIIHCSKKLIGTAECFINNKFTPAILKENYCNILQTILCRLWENCSELEKATNMVINAHHLQKEFKILVTTDSLRDENVTKEILHNLILEMELNYKTNPDIRTYIKRCENLSIYTNTDKTKILLQFAEKVKDPNLTLKILEIIYLVEDNTNLLNESVTTMLLSLSSKHAQENHSKLNETSHDFSFEENVDLNILLKGLKLAEQIISKAILNSSEENLLESLELSNWIQIVNEIIHNKTENLIINENIYSTNYVQLSITVFNALGNIFQIYFKLKDKDDDLKLLPLYLNEDVQEISFQSMIEEQFLYTTVNCLCTEGYTNIAHKLMIMLRRILPYRLTKNLHSHLTKLINQIIKALLQNVFSAPKIDTEFALDLLLSTDLNYSNDFIFENLKVYKQDLSKFVAIAKLYLHFSSQCEYNNYKILCSTITFLAKWWTKISSDKLSHSNFFKKSPSDSLEELIEQNCIAFHQIEKFCKDFELDVQVQYETYLRNCLLRWKPEYEIKTDENDQTQLIMINCEVKLLKSCKEIIEIIDDNELVINILKKLWNKINFYHYEVFICILNIFAWLEVKFDDDHKSMLLKFLTKYNRVSKPNQSEIEEWYAIYPLSQNIDCLSKWRLPFTPSLFTNQIWKIIRPEINLKTYSKWFEAALILTDNLNIDSICSYVVKNVVSSGVLQSNTCSNKWIMQEQHKNVLKEIDICVQNMSNLEQATAAVYCLITNVPEGTNKVDVIQLCYKYILQYKEQCPHSKTVHNAFVKIQMKYFSFYISNILHANNITDEKYKDIISSSPEELIEELYRSEVILKKAVFIGIHCPNINKATDQIAALYNFDIQSKRYSLIETWLSTTNAIIDFILDDHCHKSYILNKNHKHLQDLQYLTRTLYICTNKDSISKWRSWLFKQSEETKNLVYKVNLLKCFYVISNSETIEDLTGLTPNQFRIFFNKLVLINMVENFGFHLTIESLDAYKKKELLDRLAHNATTTNSAKTMAAICITYNIYKLKYWNFIINTMTKLGMFMELYQCLEFLKDCIRLRNSKMYLNSWQVVINNLLTNITEQDKEHLTDLCVSNYLIIQSCPVLHLLNLEHITRKYVEFEKYEFVALMLQYFTEDKQKYFALQLLQINSDVLKKLDDLSQYGLWNIQHTKNIIGKLSK